MTPELYSNTGEYIFDRTRGERPILIAKAEDENIAKQILSALTAAAITPTNSVINIIEKPKPSFIGVDLSRGLPPQTPPIYVKNSPVQGCRAGKRMTFYIRRANSHKLETITAPHPLIYSCKCGRIGVPKSEFRRMIKPQKADWTKRIESCKCFPNNKSAGEL